MLTVDIGLTIP